MRGKVSSTESKKGENKDQALATFKSKILQQMERNMRNNGDLQYRLTYDGLLNNQNKQNIPSLDYIAVGAADDH